VSFSHLSRSLSRLSFFLARALSLSLSLSLSHTLTHTALACIDRSFPHLIPKVSSVLSSLNLLLTCWGAVVAAKLSLPSWSPRHSNNPKDTVSTIQPAPPYRTRSQLMCVNAFAHVLVSSRLLMYIHKNTYIPMHIRMDRYMHMPNKHWTDCHGIHLVCACVFVSERESVCVKHLGTHLDILLV
jgi:hypothetical protein